jgi:hypothetical protein
MVLTGLDVEAKAAHAETLLFEILGGREQFDEVDVRLIGGDRLQVTVKDHDERLVGRRFSNAVTELALASYAGFFTTTPPGPASEFGVYWPTLVPATAVEHTVLLPDSARTVIEPPSHRFGVGSWSYASAPSSDADTVEDTRRLPLGTMCGARSGDKGGNANVGLWARSDDAFAWVRGELTIDRFRELVPEAAALDVDRYELPNLRALNFVVHGILGDGVASSVRYDPQAKGLGEFVRAQLVDVPLELTPS